METLQIVALSLFLGIAGGAVAWYAFGLGENVRALVRRRRGAAAADDKETAEGAGEAPADED